MGGLGEHLGNLGWLRLRPSGSWHCEPGGVSDCSPIAVSSWRLEGPSSLSPAVHGPGMEISLLCPGLAPGMLSWNRELAGVSLHVVCFNFFQFGVICLSMKSRRRLGEPLWERYTRRATSLSSRPDPASIGVGVSVARQGI